MERAFGALGEAPTWRELELVVETVRASGDEAAIAALSTEAFHSLVELALASGSNGFVALDLVTEFSNPHAHDSLRGV